MKKALLLTALLLLMIFAVSCESVPNPLLAQYYIIASEDNFKGIELYYFEVDGEHRFVMMGGTNRNKFADEINTLPRATLEEMKHIISTMSNEGKEQVVLHYIPTYPCPEGPVVVEYNDSIGLQNAAIMLLLGLN